MYKDPWLGQELHALETSRKVSADAWWCSIAEVSEARWFWK